MDVMYDQLIDIGLNTLGYLVAASLGILVYSSILKRKPSRATLESVAPAAQAPSVAPIPAEKPAAVDRPGLEFVNFRAPGSSGTTTAVPNTAAVAGATGATRRDRVEIIRLAREMIKAQTPQETIRRSLPISEGELALLQSSNN